MDSNAKIADLENKVRTLTQQMAKVDRHFRQSGLPAIIDEQLAAIDARKDALSQGRAA